jgi:hypothetical protein
LTYVSFELTLCGPLLRQNSFCKLSQSHIIDGVTVVDSCRCQNLHVNRTVQTFESIDKKSPPQIVRNAPVDEWADKFGTDWILTVGKTLPQTKAPEVENNNTPLIEEVIEVDSDGENLHPSPTLNPEKRHLPSNNNTNSSSARDITNDCKVAEKSTHFAKFHGGENHHPNNTNTYPKSIEDTSHKISDSNNEFGSNETVNKID